MRVLITDNFVPTAISKMYCNDDVSDPTIVNDSSFSGGGVIQAIDSLASSAASGYNTYVLGQVAQIKSNTQAQIAQTNNMSYLLIAGVIVAVLLIRK